ncbi:unnamed protein product [Rotaria socialis]|uniref:BED-type domain-containing protein n=1 Tax=Rotaria socialis TaxID=392032 RepID=A0A817XNT0_9BILA|nr:unnamed protein product [Rotaria socialis]
MNIKAGQLQTTEDSPSSSPGEFWSSLLRIKDSDDVYEPFVQCTICQQILSYDVKNETNSLKLHVQNCTKKINLPKSAMSIDCYTNKIATLSSDDKRTKYGLMKTIKSSADILIPDRTNISRTIKQIANEYRLKMNEILRKELKQVKLISISIDYWKNSYTGDNYLTISIHYRKDNNPATYMLKTILFSGTKSGENTV